MPFTESAMFLWVVLPILIFLSRIMDVTLGTMRILFVVRGSKLIAAFLGFMEVFIWITVASQIMRGSAGLFHYAAYAAGFAAGNLVGITVEARMALGLQTIRIITGECTEGLEKAFLENGYGATRLVGRGLRGGERAILYSTLRRTKVAHAIRLVEQYLPKAFILVEDVKSIRHGYFSGQKDASLRERLFNLKAK